MADDLPIDPKAPSGSPYSPIVEAGARAMLAATRPYADPDANTAPERGQLRPRKLWELYGQHAAAALDEWRITEAEIMEALEPFIYLDGDRRDAAQAVLAKIGGDA